MSDLPTLDREIARAVAHLEALRVTGQADHPRAQSYREQLAEARTLRALLARQLAQACLPSPAVPPVAMARASLWHSCTGGWELVGLYLAPWAAHAAARAYRTHHPEHLWAVRPVGPDGAATPPPINPPTDSRL